MKLIKEKRMKRVFNILIIIVLGAVSLMAEKSDSEKVDSLLKELYNKKQRDTNKVLIYKNLANLVYTKDPDNAINYAQSGLTLAKRIDYKNGVSACLNELGIAYWYKSQYPHARNCFKEALEINKETNNKQSIAKNYTNLGIIAIALSDYPAALEYYLNALKIHESLNNKKSIGIVFSNIGSLYDEQNDFTKGLEYHFKSLEIFKELNNTNLLSVNYENIGVNYLKQKRYEEALKYLNLSIELAEKKELWLSKASIFISFGDLFSEIGQFKKAIQYYNSAIDAAKIINNQSYYAKGYGQLGKMYLNMAQDSIIRKFKLNSAYNEKMRLIELSINYTLQAAKISEEIGEKKKLIEWYKVLSDAYIMLDDCKEAYKYHILWYSTKDTVHTFENKVKLADLAEKRKRDNQEKELEYLKLQEKNSKYFAFIIVTAGLLTLGMLIYLIQRQKRSNKLLTEKNLEIENANIELSIRNKYITESTLELEQLNESLLQRESQLQEANATKDKFFSIISHDLRTPFSGFLGLTDLLANEADQLTKDEIKKMGQALNEASQATYKMLNDLLEWSRIQTGTMQFNPDNIEICPIINSIIKTFNNSAANKNVTFDLNLQENIKAYADENMLSAIIRNLVSNAIKFTHFGGRIEIYCKKINSQVRIGVKDDGVGISSDVLSKLFQIDKHVTTFGTNKEKGTGLGLILCKEFVEKHNGVLSVESKENQGSHFYFTLPKEIIK